jgi:hypothetical protein
MVPHSADVHGGGTVHVPAARPGAVWLHGYAAPPGRSRNDNGRGHHRGGQRHRYQHVPCPGRPLQRPVKCTGRRRVASGRRYHLAARSGMLAGTGVRRLAPSAGSGHSQALSCPRHGTHCGLGRQASPAKRARARSPSRGCPATAVVATAEAAPNPARRAASWPGRSGLRAGRGSTRAQAGTCRGSPTSNLTDEPPAQEARHRCHHSPTHRRSSPPYCSRPPHRRAQARHLPTGPVWPRPPAQCPPSPEHRRRSPPP